MYLEAVDPCELARTDRDPLYVRKDSKRSNIDFFQFVIYISVWMVGYYPTLMCVWIRLRQRTVAHLDT